jgi:threonine dehydrogenase-like Zn-dependent dehydrogenase
MIAAVFHGVKEGLKVEERAAPVVRNVDDVLLEVKACGLCGTDPAIHEGRHPASPPVILGHEYGGIVADVGKAVHTVKPGDHVVVDPNIKCARTSR